MARIVNRGFKVAFALGFFLFTIPFSVAVGNVTEEYLRASQTPRWKRWLIKLDPRAKSKELFLRVRVKSLVRKHLALHFQNMTVRDGVAQLPHVKSQGVRSGAETLQGHIGAGEYMLEDLGPLMGWSPQKIRYAVLMFRDHDLDERKDGDKSLFNMEQKRSPDFAPIPREKWYQDRRDSYFLNGGREVVRQFLVDSHPAEEVSVKMKRSDEFRQANTDVSRVTNQVDDLQSIVEAGARYLKFREQHPRSVYLEFARQNFFDSYVVQGREIMEHRVMIIYLNYLVERVEELEQTI